MKNFVLLCEKIQRKKLKILLPLWDLLPTKKNEENANNTSLCAAQKNI